MSDTLSDTSTMSSTNKFVPALVVIDMQNDFVTGSLAVPGGADIIDNINTLVDLPFTLKIATRDLHPEKHVSFAETHGKAVFSTKTIYHPEDEDRTFGLEQVLWPVHCVTGTSGCDFVPGLNTEPFQKVVLKGVDPGVESYSAFQDIWAKNATELPETLRANQVTDVYFVGLAGDFCVKFSAIDALKLGYRTWLVEDAVKSIKDQGVVFEELRRMGIRVTTTEEVAKVF